MRTTIAQPRKHTNANLGAAMIMNCATLNKFTGARRLEKFSYLYTIKLLTIYYHPQPVHH